MERLHIRELDLNMINPNTSNMDRSDQGGSKTVVIGKPGTGKCLARDTEILMYDFSVRKIQDVRPGDFLMGDDHSPRCVRSMATGRDVMYKIRQSTGLDYIVNSEHILCLRPLNQKHCDKTFTDGKLDVDPIFDDVLEIPCQEAWEKQEQLLQHFGGYKIWINSEDEVCSTIISTMSERSKVRFLQYLRHPYYMSKKDGDERITSIRASSPCPVNPYPISIEIFSQDDEYIGFEIDGNGRFCLGDGTVTHNTTLITHLLYEKRHIFPIAFIMSGTEDSNGHYKTIVPSTFVYNKFSEKKVEDFIMRQKIAKKHLPNPWAVLLMDDCTDDPRIFNKPLFQGLYKNGRHWKMWFILSLQYCMDIKPVIRNNIDGVFILRETNLRNRKSLWENYAGVIPDFSLFCQLMDELTSEYCALYIHNATTSNKIEDCVFWYKAKPTPSTFRFGSKDIWKYHYNRYNQNYRDPFT